MKKTLIAISTAGMLLATAPTYGATTTGNIAATMTVASACMVNNSSAASGINLGTLNFGNSVSGIFVAANNIDTQLTGATSGNTFTVQCTPGVTPTVQITSNTNSLAPTTVYGTAGTAKRYLVSASVPNSGVAYVIYSDSARSNELINNGTIPVASTNAGVNSYTLYGRVAISAGTIIPVGTYTDSITVTVTY